MIFYPLQAWGIGDIIFTQTLIQKIAQGEVILWGVEPHFVDGLKRAYPRIMFIDKNIMNIDYGRRDDYTLHGIRVLPIRWADNNLNLPFKDCMKAKYMLYDQDWQTWREKAMWLRDVKKENELFELLGIKEGEDYTLINRFYGSNSQYAAEIPERGIEMCSIPGYSLFDWSKVIEKASAIHSVSTSIIYILEMLKLKSHEVHLYTRKPHEPHFNNVDYILQKQNYQLHV